MASRYDLERTCKIAKEVDASLVIHVFQTDTVDEGVCRAVTSAWIGSILTHQKVYEMLQASMDTMKTGKLDEKYVAAQKTLLNLYSKSLGHPEAMADLKQIEFDNAHIDTKLLEHSETIEGVVKEIDALPDLVQRRLRISEEVEKKDALYKTKAAVDKRAEEIADKMHDIFLKKNAYLASNGVRDHADLFIPVRQDLRFGNYKGGVTGLWPNFEGLLFLMVDNVIADGPGHCFGFSYRRGAECRFFDANTGEWAFATSAGLDAFFSDYYAEFYGTKFDTHRVGLCGFNVQAYPTKAHRGAKPCPFSPCPFAGFFTLACAHNDV